MKNLDLWLCLNFFIVGFNFVWMIFILINRRYEITNRRQVRIVIYKALFWPFTVVSIIRNIVFFFRKEQKNV